MENWVDESKMDIGTVFDSAIWMCVKKNREPPDKKTHLVKR